MRDPFLFVETFISSNKNHLYILLINNYSSSSTVLIKTCYNFLLIHFCVFWCYYEFTDKTSRKITIARRALMALITHRVYDFGSPHRRMALRVCVAAKQSYLCGKDILIKNSLYVVIGERIRACTPLLLAALPMPLLGNAEGCVTNVPSIAAQYARRSGNSIIISTHFHGERA